MTSTSAQASQRLNFLNDVLADLKDKHLFQALKILQSPQGVEIIVNGQACINFSSNNYLGLATHPALKKAAIEAIETYGVGAGSVRSIIGTMSLHDELEQKLATFKRTEGTLVLQSGFTANQAAIPSVVSEGDAIISDELNHASIIDACRLLKNVSRYVYPHSNMDVLEAKLKEAQGARRRLIITDGVFSMDGDIAKLDRIVELAEAYDAMVMVDDAHASGVLGHHGSGTTSHFNLYGRVDIQVGTLSKAIGAMGGYVAGTQALREVMINRARPFLFSTAHPPSVAATCIKALELLQSDPSLHARLWENTHRFKAGLREMGFQIDSETPITPVIVGSAEKAQKFSQRLFECGIYGQAIVFPTVAADKARVRFILSAAHEPHHLDKALDVISTLKAELSLC